MPPTAEAQLIIDKAKRLCISENRTILEVKDLVRAILLDPNNIHLLNIFLQGQSPTPLTIQQYAPDLTPHTPKMGIDQDVLDILQEAKNISPNNDIDVAHLICALVQSAAALKELKTYINVNIKLKPFEHSKALEILTLYLNGSKLVAEEIKKIDTLQHELRENVFGQDNAIKEVVDGLRTTICSQLFIQNRSGPIGVFILAGPPGVGKTSTVQIIANQLSRPFKEFELTTYADLAEFAGNVQFDGLLGRYVSQHPNAIIAINDIEKTHPLIQRVFLTILDSGLLENRASNSFVSFKDTILFFTTNAGKILYDSKAHYRFNRNMILQGLETLEKIDDMAEKIDKLNTERLIPHNLVSRFGKGYPILYQNLQTKDYIKIIEFVFKQIKAKFVPLCPKLENVSWQPQVPVVLLFQEAGNIDGRQIKAQAEKFMTNLRAKFDELKDPTTKFDEITAIDIITEKPEKMPEELKPLYANDPKNPITPNVLLVSNSRIYENFKQVFGNEINLIWSQNLNDIEKNLIEYDFDLCLMDLWLDSDVKKDYDTVVMHQIMDILTILKSRTQDLPTYLLSCEPEKVPAPIKNKLHFLKEIDDYLFLQCATVGNIHGMISTCYDFQKEKKELLDKIKEIQTIYSYEKVENTLNNDHHIIRFDFKLEIINPNSKLKTGTTSKPALNVILSNFRTEDAVEAKDLGQFLDDVERPQVHFDEIIGVEDAKKELNDILDMLSNPRKYKKMGVRSPKGILLTGPPGTGKTLLARALAGSTKRPFIPIDAASLGEIYYGSGTKNLREKFERAKKYAPSIVFIDEIDSIGKNRGESGASHEDEKVLNVLLTQMDGFQSDLSTTVIVIAATNKEKLLDPALKRRFDRIVNVGLPDRLARLQYLKKFLGEKDYNEVPIEGLENIATISIGMSLSDLERVIYEAKKIAVRDNHKKINQKILDEAFEVRMMGLRHAEPSIERLTKTAVHEAGHALIGYLDRRIPEVITIIGRGNYGGYVSPESDEDKGTKCKSDLEKEIRESLGGRAAELIKYGEDEGMNTGASQDLLDASKTAVNMIRVYGMDDNIDIIYTEAPGAFTETALNKVNETASKVIKRELANAKQMIKDHIDMLDKLVKKLITDKNRMLKPDLIELLLIPEFTAYVEELYKKSKKKPTLEDIIKEKKFTKAFLEKNLKNWQEIVDKTCSP